MLPLQPPVPIPNRLHGHVCIITGAAGFIGLETTRRLLSEGSKVVMVDIDEAKLESARESVESSMPEGRDHNASRILTVRANVTTEADVESFVDQTIKHFGRLDSAFLCAGLSYSSTPVLDTSVDLYDQIMEVNCRSGTQYAFRFRPLPCSIPASSSFFVICHPTSTPIITWADGSLSLVHVRHCLNGSGGA
jgi:NAD(P)-dependent dehydrogenase (short-subunit alcohol dehydrogenase family)